MNSLRRAARAFMFRLMLLLSLCNIYSVHFSNIIPSILCISRHSSLSISLIASSQHHSSIIIVSDFRYFEVIVAIASAIISAGLLFSHQNTNISLLPCSFPSFGLHSRASGTYCIPVVEKSCPIQLKMNISWNRNHQMKLLLTRPFASIRT